LRAAVIGHVEWVDFLRVESVPKPGEIVHASDSWSLPAGGGAGAAVQLAKLCDDTVFFTAFGDDEIGHRAFRELTEFGVRVHAEFRPTPSRRAVVHVDASGERTITVLGERLGPKGSEDLHWGELAGVDAVYFTAGDAGAAREGRRAKVFVATARALPVLQQAGIRIDAIVSSAVDPSEIYEPGDLAPAPNLVVRTEGERGGTYVTGDKVYKFDPAPVAGPIVDRYGAGDSFAGCLTYALGVSRPPGDAVSFAARCGAAAVTGRGPYEKQPRMPPRPEG
jgi:ribokinase